MTAIVTIWQTDDVFKSLRSLFFEINAIFCSTLSNTLNFCDNDNTYHARIILIHYAVIDANFS